MELLVGKCNFYHKDNYKSRGFILNEEPDLSAEFLDPDAVDLL
jgi:hypothetical protein